MMNPETMVDKTFKLIADCMDTVYTKEDAWDSKDYSPNERIGIHRTIKFKTI